MRFLCDENITRKAAKLIQKEGHNVETVQSMNLEGTTNSKLLQKTVSSQLIKY